MSDWTGSDAGLSALSPDDRAFAYGDGLFETIAIRRGRARFWSFHCERLQLGCMRLGIDAPSEADLERVLRRAVESQSASDGTVKILLSRGTGPRGYRPPDKAKAQLWSRFWPEDYASIEKIEHSGIELRFASMLLSRQTALAGMKHLNRLEQVVGGKNAPEVLFCDARKNVVCGRMSNVFFFNDDRLCTPGLSHSGVAGIARRAVLHVAHGDGLEVQVDNFSVRQVLAADEVFLCNSRYLLRPVHAIAGRRYQSKVRTRELAERVQELARSL